MSTTTSPYSIGGKGPGGGIVFHIDSTGLHGMEARPAAEAKAMIWPYAFDYVAALVRQLGSGWRLPTIEELQLLYQQRETAGGFNHDFHWSSSEFNSDAALSLVDINGNVYPLRKKGDACYVRAVRDFDPNDPIRSETRETPVRIEPDESIVWSDHWRYNYDKTFTQQEKDEILMGVKMTALTPDPSQAAGYTWENSSFSVYIYWKRGVWEINGATRKETTPTKPVSTWAKSIQPDIPQHYQPRTVEVPVSPLSSPIPRRKWWHFWK